MNNLDGVQQEGSGCYTRPPVRWRVDAAFKRAGGTEGIRQFIAKPQETIQMWRRGEWIRYRSVVSDKKTCSQMASYSCRAPCASRSGCY